MSRLVRSRYRKRLRPVSVGKSHESPEKTWRTRCGVVTVLGALAAVFSLVLIVGAAFMGDPMVTQAESTGSTPEELVRKLEPETQSVDRDGVRESTGLQTTSILQRWSADDSLTAEWEPRARGLSPLRPIPKNERGMERKINPTKPMAVDRNETVVRKQRETQEKMPLNGMAQPAVEKDGARERQKTGKISAKSATTKALKEDKADANKDKAREAKDAVVIPTGPFKGEDLLYTGNCGKRLAKPRTSDPLGRGHQYLFATGFRSPVYHAIKGVNNFLRAANATGRTLVGPFINPEFSFKLSSFADATTVAPDFIGNYFSLGHLQVFNSLCMLGSGAHPSALCPNPDDRLDVCIGQNCGSTGAALWQGGKLGTDLDAHEDLVDTLLRNPVVKKAKCVIVHNYNKGVQDVLLKRDEYTELYQWKPKQGMDKTSWLYHMFRPSKSMRTLASRSRAVLKIKPNEFHAVHLRSRAILRRDCDKRCDCSLKELSVAAALAGDEYMQSRHAPVYFAWDVSSDPSVKISADLRASAEEALEAELGTRLRRFPADGEPARHVFMDVLHLVESKACVSFGGGAVLAAVNFLRLDAGKEPCATTQLFAPSRGGTCKFVLV